MGLKKLQVPIAPLVISEMIHPHHGHESIWRRIARYGIQPNSDGIQVYAQPSTLRQITSLRDALTAIIRAWKREPEVPRSWETMAVTEYWAEHYVTSETDPRFGSYSMCSLCANQGVIDTRPTAVSPKGNHLGRLNYCICPNGQSMRASKAPLKRK